MAGIWLMILRQILLAIVAQPVLEQLFGKELVDRLVNYILHDNEFAVWAVSVGGSLLLLLRAAWLKFTSRQLVDAAHASDPAKPLAEIKAATHSNLPDFLLGLVGLKRRESGS